MQSISEEDKKWMLKQKSINKMFTFEVNFHLICSVILGAILITGILLRNANSEILKDHVTVDTWQILFILVGVVFALCLCNFLSTYRTLCHSKKYHELISKYIDFKR